MEKFTDDLEPVDESKTRNSIAPWIITILISAWLIGMAILGAGWLISREIANQSNNAVNLNENGENIERLGFVEDLQIPENTAQQGSGDAKVTVVEFADYQCPFCGRWGQDIYPKLKAEFIDTGKVKFVYWDFAFLGEESFLAAEAAMCAKDQGKYWDYHDKLFANQAGENSNAFSINNLKIFGKQVGLNETEFNSCVDSRIYKPIVEEISNQASELGVISTPTVLINGIPLEGILPWESYKQVIETELAK